MARRLALGLDFGTESARAVLADVENGAEAASVALPYPHGTMGRNLPDGTPLPPDWALQDPRDYLAALDAIVPEVMRQAGASAGDVVGIGLDFAACTVLPVVERGRPLCAVDGFQDKPHAWAKTPEHRDAQPAADRLTELLAQRDPERLARFGGRVSPEWLWPKIAQVAEEAPCVFDAAHAFVEAGDWIVAHLTGLPTRSACQAGYRAMWEAGYGDISGSILEDLHPRLAGIVGDKVYDRVSPVGQSAGGLSAARASGLGLRPGTPVSVALIPGPAALPAAGISAPGDVLMLMGEGLCHIALNDSLVPIRGIAGVVQDGVLPGFHGYEAGQPVVGGVLQWLTGNFVPQAYHDEARARGMDILALLREKAAAIPPGASGLLALDWWKGSRSILQDPDLTGLILGFTLDTRPEEVFRAFIEALAFGTRVILDAFTAEHIPVERLAAAGGFAEQHPLMMQVFADVTERRIRMAKSPEPAALGSAIHGAVAAGAMGGGYDTFPEAIAAMGGVKGLEYVPNENASAVYRRLYAEYQRLHQMFGQGGNDVMHRLKHIQRETRPQPESVPGPPAPETPAQEPPMPDPQSAYSVTSHTGT